MEQFTLRDFSGGLNTSMDEANIPANMTASLCNVDFLDSKAITRRNGYARITATPPAALPVDALYRYYQKDGDKYWLSVCGTALYTKQSLTTEMPPTRIEAETAFVAGSGWFSTYSKPSDILPFSAGFAMQIPNTTATGVFSVPYSTQILVGYWGPDPVRCTVKIDSLAASTIWEAATFSGLSATSHTVSIRRAAVTATTALIDYIDYSAVSPYSKQIGTLTATTDTFAFATLNNNAYLSSAYDPLMKFTGASLVTITATHTPSCAFMVEKGRRLFGAGSAADPSKLYYTELDSPEDWGKSGTQNGIYVAGKDSGGNCTGLAVSGDLLFYFSESCTYGLDTRGLPANWVSKALSTSHGCIAPKSIAVAPNAVIFLSGDGVRAYGSVQNVYSDDGSAFTILSDNIKPTLAAYTDAEKRKAVGALYKNRYWLAIGSDVYVCDLEKRTENNQPPWTYYNGHDINCFCVTRADEYGLYAGSKTNGHLYQLDTGGNDNGAAISMLYKTPPLAPKGYTSVKHFRHLHMAAEAPQAQAVAVAVSTDDVSPPSETVAFDALNDIQPKRLLTPGRGRSAQVRISSDGMEQNLSISELTMTYNPKPRVR